jgi:hypothetical protein
MAISKNKRMLKYQPITGLVLLFFFISCENSGDYNHSCTGKANEIIVVIDDDLWNGQTGQELTKILTTKIPGLPQDEPSFDISHFPEAALNEDLRHHRNIILVKLAPNDTVTRFTSKEDIWSDSQTFLEISGKTDADIAIAIKANAAKLFDTFIIAERERIMQNYNKHQELRFDPLLKKHHLSMVIPKGYQIDADSSDFAWLSSSTPDTKQGIFIYTYQYSDTNTFSPVYLLNKRDSVLSCHAPEANSGTWMASEHQFQTVCTSLNLNQQFAFEIRGLWKEENNFMGGPFISLTLYDKPRNRIVTVEGYLYAPKYDKRNYLRELEAILYSVKILP